LIIYTNSKLKEKLYSQDVIIYDVCKKLSIPIDSMSDEFYCRKNKTQLSLINSKNKSFIHPYE